MEGLWDIIIPSLSSFTAAMMTKFLVSYHTVTGWNQEKELWRKNSMKTRETKIRLPAPGSVRRTQSDQSRLDSRPSRGYLNSQPGPLHPGTPLFLKNPRPLPDHDGVFPFVVFFSPSVIINLLVKEGNTSGTLQGDWWISGQKSFLEDWLSKKWRGGNQSSLLLQEMRVSHTVLRQTKVGFLRTRTIRSPLPKAWVITITLKRDRIQPHAQFLSVS